MKKIILTFCAFALTAIVAQAQTSDVRAAHRAQQVKQESASQAAGQDAKAVNTSESRAQYEAFKAKQMEARKARTETNTSNKTSQDKPSKSMIKPASTSKNIERKTRATQAPQSQTTNNHARAEKEKIRREN